MERTEINNAAAAREKAIIRTSAIGIGAKSENLGEVEAFIDYVLEEKQP